MDTDISHVSNSSHSPRLVQPQGPFLMQPPMTPNTPSTCNPVPSANVLTSAADMEFSHKRTPSTQSEPDMALDRNDTFFTPQAKLVKPNPAAFHSTGLLSRKNRPRMTGHTMPETPLKKQFPYPPFRAAGTGGLLQKQHRLPGNSPFDLSLDHSNSTPARELLGSVRSKHNRSPFAETPVKNAKKVHLDSGFGHPSHLVDMTPQPPVRSFWQAISQESDSLTPQHPSIQPWPAGGESGLQSPASTRTRTRSQSSPPVQTSSLFQSRSGLFSSQIKRRPSASSTAIEDVFSASPGTTSKGLFGHATSKTNDGDMMDCDDGDPDIALEIHHRRSYSNLITGYPVFLTVGYLQRLHARGGRPPSPDQFSQDEVHPDYLDANFRIISRLGRGSFADAYKVQSKLDGKLYAVKKTRQAFTGYKDGLSKLEEVEILWNIGNNDHCVCLINAWVQHGHLHLQMDLCEGGSLQVYLEEKCRDVTLDELRTWRILTDVALGLKHIHDLQLVHLDIKPGNVFITNDGRLKIGDFGVASRSPVPRGDDREGDRTYIAPEILRDSMFGKPADVFSLGLIILEVTANVILPENGPYWHKLREGDLSEINFGETTSPALLDLIRSMLDPKPTRRPTVDAILTHPYVLQLQSSPSPLDGSLLL